MWPNPHKTKSTYLIVLFAIFSENLVFVLFNMGDANYKDYNIGISCFSCVWRRA